MKKRIPKIKSEKSGILLLSVFIPMHFKKIVIRTVLFFNQIITDRKNGFLCKPKNPKSIMETIDKVRKLSKEEKIKIQNSPEKMTSELLDYYDWAISDR